MLCCSYFCFCFSSLFSHRRLHLPTRKPVWVGSNDTHTTPCHTNWLLLSVLLLTSQPFSDVFSLQSKCVCVCVTDTIQNRYNIFAVCNAKRRHCFTHHSIWRVCAAAQYTRSTLHILPPRTYSFMLMDFSSTSIHTSHASYTWIWHLALNLMLLLFFMSFSFAFLFFDFFSSDFVWFPIKCAEAAAHQSYLTTIVHTVWKLLFANAIRHSTAKFAWCIILDEHWTRQNCNLLDWGDFLIE